MPYKCTSCIRTSKLNSCNTLLLAELNTRVEQCWRKGANFAILTHKVWIGNAIGEILFICAWVTIMFSNVAKVSIIRFIYTSSGYTYNFIYLVEMCTIAITKPGWIKDLLYRFGGVIAGCLVYYPYKKTFPKNFTLLHRHYCSQTQYRNNIETILSMSYYAQLYSSACFFAVAIDLLGGICVQQVLLKNYIL